MIIYEAKIAYSQRGEIEPKKLVDASDVRDYLLPAIQENPMQETMFVIALNRKNIPLGFYRATVGTVSSALVHPREIFRFAIMESASGVIVAHNHPSGDPSPSAADTQITRTLREASRILEIDLLDHVIIGDISVDKNKKGYYSFRDTGII